MAPTMTKEETSRPASQESASEDVSRDNATPSTSEHRSNSDSQSNHGSEDGEASESEAVNTAKESYTGETNAPPLPAEDIPPLPSEAPPGTEAQADDGWEPVWDAGAQAFYFYNRFTGASQWDNPRVPSLSTTSPAPAPAPAPTSTPPPPATTGYNPAIHGDYDPTAWYAQPSTQNSESTDPSSSRPLAPGQDPTAQYAATAAFNRFTGRFQNADITPENFNDENKSRRQMNAFFDVDAAANSHDGRSLKAERSGKKLSKMELKQFKEKRKMKKEEKRRAWLRD